MSTVSFIASLHIFIGGLGLLLNIMATIRLVLNASKPVKTETIYGLSDTISGAVTSITLFSDGCLYFAYSLYNDSCLKYHLIFMLWLFPLITGHFSVLGLAIERHKELKLYFHQPAERQRLFTIVWLLTTWFTAVASIIILGGHATPHRALAWESQGQKAITRANRGLLEDLWVHNSKNDWTSDYRENAIIGLVYGIIGGNISHEALERFQGNSYSKETIQANLKKIKQLHVALGITSDDIKNVFGTALNAHFENTDSGVIDLRPLSYWEDTTLGPKTNNQVAFTTPKEALLGTVGAFNRPIAALFTRPVEAITRPENVHTRPVGASARPVVAFQKPEEGFPGPIAAFTRPVEPSSRPALAFTRPVEAHSRPAGDQSNKNQSLFWPSLSEIISKLHNKETNKNKNIQSGLLNVRENENTTSTVDFEQYDTLLPNTDSQTIDLSPVKVTQTTMSSARVNSRSTETPTMELAFQTNTTSRPSVQNPDQETKPIDHTEYLHGASEDNKTNQDLISTSTPINEPNVTGITNPLQATSSTCISQAGFLPVFVSIIFVIAFMLPLTISSVLYAHSAWVSRENMRCARNPRWSNAQGMKKKALVILIANLACWMPLMVERLVHAWEKTPDLSLIVPSLLFLLAQAYNVLRALLHIFYNEKLQANLPTALSACARRCNTAVAPLDSSNSGNSELATDSHNANQRSVVTNTRAPSSRKSSANKRSSNNTPTHMLWHR